MHKLFKWLLWSTGGFIALTVFGVAVCWGLLYSALPHYPDRLEITGIKDKVSVAFDSVGVPIIEAGDRNDAYYALGFILAHDRLFQMDLMRRSAAGRLAEIFGTKAVPEDERHRVMGFDQVAHAVVERLPDAQRSALEAYRDGINAGIAQRRALPLEFKLLGYTPEPWRCEDSILIVLRMYETLSNTVDDERMVTVMKSELPPKVVEFLTPKMDRYTARLLNTRLPEHKVPVAELHALLAENRQIQTTVALAEPAAAPNGSNAWVVAPGKTRNGRAILANDPHLKLTLPNIWYRVHLAYAGKRLTGATIPGIPSIISGANGHVAWGYTNVQGDFLDLVEVTPDPTAADRYQTPSGSEPYTTRQEVLQVRGAENRTLSVRMTRWGPVVPGLLPGRTLALHWVALDPEATNLGMLDLDRVEDIYTAQEVFRHTGGPPQNVMLADDKANIGWMIMGRVPKREGLDGSAAESWLDARRGWHGYIDPAALPHVENPPQGYLVTANQRTVPLDHPVTLGHNFSAGYRARRVAQVLDRSNNIDERDMLNLQLDTKAAFYRYYQQLALKVLASATDTTARDLSAYLRAWNGRADTDSVGLPLVVEFRTRLTNAVFSPFLARCRTADPKFVYRWRMSDEALRALIDLAPPELLPDGERYPTWSAWLASILRESATALAASHGVENINVLTWGRINQTHINHPLSQIAAPLGLLLDMPNSALAGCGACVRVATDDRKGASERIVVAPGHEHDGLYEMPGGQSENRLSPHYGDHELAWVSGLPMKLIDKPTTRVELIPKRDPPPVD